jgi:hypothetical protein
MTLHVAPEPPIVDHVIHLCRYLEIDAQLSPGLLDEACETLLRLGQSGCDREEILLGVAGLTVDSDRCPGCNALQTTERDLVQAVVRSFDTSSPATLAPPMCLHHALLVVNGGIDAPRARAVVQRLGTTMVRLSEDMHIYALKREALHGGRISPDEEGAAVECLALLAGSAVR